MEDNDDDDDDDPALEAELASILSSGSGPTKRKSPAKKGLLLFICCHSLVPKADIDATPSTYPSKSIC